MLRYEFHWFVYLNHISISSIGSQTGWFIQSCNNLKGANQLIYYYNYIFFTIRATCVGNSSSCLIWKKKYSKSTVHVSKCNENAICRIARHKHILGCSEINRVPRNVFYWFGTKTIRTSKVNKIIYWNIKYCSFDAKLIWLEPLDDLFY